MNDSAIGEDTGGGLPYRSSHPLFDPGHYLSQRLDLSQKPGPDDGSDPFVDYATRGWRAMLSPHPLFDPAWYLLENPDVLRADIEPVAHYLDEGWKQGRRLHPLFDTRWYLDAHPDLRDGDLDPLSHYLTTGWREGGTPHPLFAPDWYRETHGLDAGTDPWLDYVLGGWRAGRSPHPRFDTPWYEERYLDPATHPCEPLAHYLDSGWREGLIPSADAAGMQEAAPKPGDTVAPLYREMCGEAPATSADPAAPALPDAPVVPIVPARASSAARTQQSREALRADGRRGKLLLVTHDTQLGGAPHVLKLFAEWVRSSTRFSVGIVAVEGGQFQPDFEAVAPVFVLAAHPEEERAGALKAWAGPDVRAVFVNSVASGGFYRYWHEGTPSVAFVHELKQTLELYADEMALIREHADHVVSGGPDVARLLSGTFGFDPDRLTSAHSFIEALPPGDDEAARLHRRAEARAAFDVPDGRILVMGCGLMHWRKSPDKFVETAERVLASGLDAQFVWMGGGVDEAACIAMAEEKGLSDRVRFTGYEPDVTGRMAGADIFLLSSQEDPFPLVMLYAAQAGVPIVCFREAGGAEGFVEGGSGTAVPFMDIGAMAGAVTAYARDAGLRARAGEIGRHQVAATHTIDVVGPMLLHHLRAVAALPPEVSVVLPNYNYETYLPERLATIAGQTFQDFEVILLDDASSDGSARLLEAFAAFRPGTRTRLGTENSGSPFAQWMRGMEMAAAEIVWLAEADDYCEDDLLSTLLPFFDDRNMRIASCASLPVQSDGTMIGDYRPIYLDRIRPGRWDADFTATDHEEIDDGLGIANTIPNASAVLIRKFDPDPQFAAQVAGMRLCGDWFFYVRAMKGGLIGFSAAALNYHRRHGETVTHRLEGSLRYFEELAEVRTHIGRTYRQSAQARARVAGFLAQDVARFGVEDPSTLARAPEPEKALPSLAVIAPDLSPGGGQIFAISLANEWVARGGRAILLNAGSQPTHPAVLRKLDPVVSLFHAGEPGAELDTLVERFDIDVLHSSIWWSDITVDAHRERLPGDIPWVITMHGCHETILRHPEVDPAFSDRMGRMAKRASAWVHTADKNLEVFDTHERPDRLRRIPNGMRQDTGTGTLTRAGLGLREEALVLCLASRAIPSKGWEQAVDLTRTLNAGGEKVDLLLIGEGPSADAIREAAPDHVHLVGQVSNLQDYFAVADVGILPSSFVGESLPLVLIEMMARSLPLVATDVGEIPGLIGTGDDAAGLLVPIRNGIPDMHSFLRAVRQMMESGSRRRMGRNARARFDEAFRLDRMVDAYAALYDEVGARTWKDDRHMNIDGEAD